MLAPVLAIARATFGASSVLFHRLEKVRKYQARGYPKKYVAIVRKPMPVVVPLRDAM